MSIENAIERLNSMVSADERAMRNLVTMKHPCSQALANHPTAIVGNDNRIGLMGVLNGIFGEEGKPGPIAAMIDTKTGRLSGFCRYQEPVSA